MSQDNSTQIEGVEFFTTKYMPTRAYELMFELISVLGEGFLAIAQADPNTEISLANGTTLNALSRLDPKAALALIPKILAGTTAVVQDERGGKQIPLGSQKNIDMVFKDLPFFTMFKVAAHALQVQFGNFSLGSAPAGAPQTAAA